MNKVTRILLALGLILALAAPAFAGDFKLNGYYRLMGYTGELKDSTEEGDSQQWTAQRLRMMMTYSLNDNVAVVYHAEVDTDWGLKSKGSIGGGGEFGADGVNVETKNAYLDLKFGDTAARLGVLGYADDFDGIVVNADMSGVYATQKFGNTTLKGIYAKWYETDKSYWDDQDFWGLTVDHKFNDNWKGLFSVFFVDNNNAETTTMTDYDKLAATINDLDKTFNGDSLPPISGSDVEDFFTTAEWKSLSNALKTVGASLPSITYDDYATRDTWYFGPRLTYTGDKFVVDGFVVFQDGTLEYNLPKGYDAKDVDSFSYFASLKGTYKLENGDLNLRILYNPADDDCNDADYWMADYDQYAFVNENQMIFLIDPYVTDWVKENYALNDAAKQGFGLMGFVLSGNHKLQNDMYAKWGVGYYMADDDARNEAKGKLSKDSLVSSSSDLREGDTLGFEVAARFGKKFFEKVDVSINGAYADFGDFYDNTVKDDKGKVSDPDAIWKAYLMVNVPF